MIVEMALLMKRGFVLIVFSALFLFAGSMDAMAQCSCAYVTPDSKYVEIVFIGTLENIEQLNNARRYTIRISESFKGLGHQTTVEAFDGFYNCNLRRQIGREYLFLAKREEGSGKIEIVGCSYSYINVHQQQQMIEILRWKRDSTNDGGIIVGKVSSVADREGSSQKPVGVDKVFLENNKGEMREARIEPNGFYRFTALSKGNYRVFISLPNTLTTYGDANDFDDMRSNRPNVLLGDGEGRIEDFHVLTNGVISGRISAQDGTPVGGITVSLVGVDGGTDDSTEADKDGRYSFTGVPPGKYTIRAGAQDWYVSPNSVDAIYPITFYGDQRLQPNAKRLSLMSGQVINDIDIRWIPRLGKKVLRGQVLLPDGKPAQNANVKVQIRRNDPNLLLRSGWYVMTRTDRNGNFELDVYDETDYLLQVDIDTRTGPVTVDVLFSSGCFKLPTPRPTSPISVLLKKGDIDCVKENLGF